MEIINKWEPACQEGSRGSKREWVDSFKNEIIWVRESS